ncbi:MAG: M15 family metallopeptidase, partial [Nitrososphaeraceae archaeon]
MQVPKSNIIKKSLLVLLSVLLFSSVVFGDILPLDERIKNEMRGVSCHTGCPVGLDELRLVRVKYYSFDETTKNGELVVHKDVADEVLKIFGELYDIHYPIKQIVRIEKFKGNDFDSIEADNTSASNCRNT